MLLMVTMNSLKINLMSLKCDPLNNVQLPIAYQDWVSIEFAKMHLRQLSRSFDSVQETKFGQITLLDTTIPQCHRTLIY